MPPSRMAHTDSHDEAVRAFNNADQGPDATETIVALAIAQYHATMATYELGLQMSTQLSEIATLLADHDTPSTTPGRTSADR